MTFKEKLKNYADLLVTHGLNVQPGQVVNISTEALHRDLALMAVESAYERGAKFVNLDLNEPRLTATRIKLADPDSLDFVPPYVKPKYESFVEMGVANLSIRGPEYPDILVGLDTKLVNKIRMANHKAVKFFYDEGIGKSRVQWSLGSAATPAWGKKIFPDLTPEAACEALWEQIFKVTRCDQDNWLELWQEHNRKLHSRSQKLSELKVKELHFEGPGTDLVVGLSERAIFKGGTDQGPKGVEFEPNIPTEEVFTTPDYRVTSGRVKTTRPFLINGVLIQNLELEFENGQVSNFSASSGEETFKEYSSSDEGASRLGEVALVGIDSPIFETGLVFQDILFDENAACHIAIGSAYKFCLEKGDSLSKEELEAIGCNESSVHTDMMISDENTSVTATTYSGETVKLIEAGSWTI